MKRLRVLLVCLIVALLCWYPIQHVSSSEQSPGQSAGDRNPEGQEQEKEQDSIQHKVLDEWKTHTSYGIELEAETTSHEKLEIDNASEEKTVNAQEVEVKETKPDPESDAASAAPESEPDPDPQTDLDPKTDTKDSNQEVPVPPATESAPVEAHIPSDAPPSLEFPSDAPAAHSSLDLHPATSSDDAENTPTSESACQTHAGAVRVVSAGDELPVDNFVFDEHSHSQCGVIPPKLATCENSPFGSLLLRVDEAGIDDQLTDQNHRSDPEVEDWTSSGHVDQEQQEQQQLQEIEDGQFDLDQEGNFSRHHPEQKEGETSAARETDPSVPSKEDIPTFDEWKKKVMEVEKEKSQSLSSVTNGCPHPVKKVQKNFNNYASDECGAKILSANSEAKSMSSILMENMDLYMLNPCSTKIWFVIELCEPIQVKQLDIANFELFSSTPKDFLVSISDRYPTNKWVKLGTFHAHDSRTVQSFPLDEQLYAKYVKMFIKYVKVELLSHFGSEHFCPLSLIRVFGTSMVEEYDEIAESQYPSERLDYLDEDFDFPPGYQPSEDKASKNLLGSATNAILNMVNNIAANVLGGKPGLEGGTETGENTTAAEHEKGSTEVTPKSSETTQVSAISEPAEQEDSAASSDPPPSPPDSHEDQRIVTLVEEDEDEEPRQTTVTLMEDGEEEEEKAEETTREAGDRNQWESQTYCPFSSFSSLSLSCMVTLPELLHRWCSARLAKERLRSLRRKQLSIHAQTRPDQTTPFPAHTPQLSPALDSTPVKEVLPLTEQSPEPNVPVMSQNEGMNVGEVHFTHPNTPDAHTPELNIILEPSRVTIIPTDSLSDIQSSLSLPTPTHDEKLLPHIKYAALDPIPITPLHAVSIPETLMASSATSTPTVSFPPQPLASETGSPGVVVPPLVEQPVQPLPTASKPEEFNPPPTELPTAAPPTDIHSDAAQSSTDNGDSQIHDIQTSQTHWEQRDSPSQAGEPRRVEEPVDEDILSTNGHRTTTDFYAELQNGGDYASGTVNGNGALLNGGVMHSSSQKESVFMRLNNRIKALEVNMSLSSRYLEELSQRYRKQMEEMQRAFNKTIIKLQNTSRIAEEQDQKQTESIQVLQSQLESVTKMMINLTVTVGQLQREVSDRQSYLVVSLVLCLSLGFLLCLQCCCSSTPSPNNNASTLPMSNHYPSPKRCFSSYDDMSLKRRVTCPLVRSKSFHLSSTDGPDDLYIVEPLRFSPEKKKKRCKSKSLDKADILKAIEPPPLISNGGPKCNGFQPSLPLTPPPPPPPPPLPLMPPPPAPNPPSSSLKEVSLLPTCTSKDFPLENSSSSSPTHSEEWYASCLPPPSQIVPFADLCNGHDVVFPQHQPLAKSRQEKRSMKRQKLPQTELQFPSIPGEGVGSLPSLQHLMKGNKQISVGTIGVTAVSGHV
ncbi:SUN domain-containing ossification factor isoform X2 [Antennarius striatus]|uniref:SUN domain-containing ossification factor isoform X2 n=1 Tax=Antennarius striatus TaxID=241820 RepID=UPI0035AEDFCB